MRPLAIFAAFVACTIGAAAQAPGRPLAPSLRPYTTCRLSGGPELVDVTPLLAPNSTRAVQTAKGDRHIQLVDGVRLMFAYPNSDFFANMKVEELPAATYTQQKGDLIDNFEYLLSSSVVNTRNQALQPSMQGFETRGLDRQNMDGGVLGVYLLFDNTTHMAITVYFLNQEPTHRKFSSMQEYASLRDSFLQRYTACMRQQLSH